MASGLNELTLETLEQNQEDLCYHDFDQKVYNYKSDIYLKS